MRAMGNSLLLLFLLLIRLHLLFSIFVVFIVFTVVHKVQFKMVKLLPNLLLFERSFFLVGLEVTPTCM